MMLTGRPACLLFLIILNSQVVIWATLGPDHSEVGSSAQHELAPVVSDEDKAAAERHYERGKLQLKEKKYDEAIAAFSQALAIYPDWESAKRALSWARKDKRRQLVAETTGLVSLHDLIIKAQDQYQQGQQLENEGRPIEAAAKYKAALRMIPGYPEALAALDRLQLATQKTLSKHELEIANQDRTQPPDIKLSNPRADQRYQVTKKIKQSAAIPKRSRPVKQNIAIKEAIQNHYLAGTRAYQRQDYATAINEFELILEFMPAHTKALFYLNKAKKKLYQQVKEIEKEVEQAQNQGNRIDEIQGVHAIMNIDPSNQSARKAWERAKQDKKNLTAAFYRKGVDAYAKGDYQQAMKHWELVLGLDPEHKKTLESMKKVREKLEIIR